jgi:pilus assembly protein Flp/PilA
MGLSFSFPRFLFERTGQMRKFGQALVNFLKREDGPTAVEYAVMLALIIVVCITAITTLGTNANKTFTSVGAALGSTTGS